MNKKAAVELSMNFMVVIILGIVVLSMGVYLSVNAFNKAKEIDWKLEQQTTRQIYDLLDSGDPVVVPLNTASVEPGEHHVFGIGVRNLEYGSNFKVMLEGVEVDGCDAGNKKNIQFLMEDLGESSQTKPKFIKENEGTIFEVAVRAPANSEKCEYVINAKVMRCPEDTPNCVDPSVQYDAMQKIYLTVI